MSARTVQSVADFRSRAEARLPQSLWHYLQEGDDGRNAAALASWHIVPRPLSRLREGHTRMTLFGQTYEHPVMLAPVAYQRLYHPDGERAAAAAAAAQGGVSVISSLASISFDAISSTHRELQGPPPWLQLYWQGDRDRTARLLARGLEAGCSAIVFTVDAPVKRSNFVLPAGVTAPNANEPLPPATHASATGSRVFDDWMARAPTWADVEWLRSRIGGHPLVLKGVLHPDDAERAARIGCDAVIVSNHGGRVLDRAPASAHALPAIVQRVGHRIAVLLDGGIGSGADVFTALALGARAVLVGRSFVWGLAVDGALGVARVIRLLRDELEMTMALAGCRDIASIDRRMLLPSD